MNLNNIYKILLLSNSKRLCELVDNVLFPKDLAVDYTNIFSLSEINSNINYDLLIIDKDYYLDEELEEIKKLKNALQIIVLTSKMDFDKSFKRLYSSGIIVIKSNVSDIIFDEIMKIIIFSSNKIIDDSELSYESKMINVAKSLLITNKNMTENEAHKFIEKSSMNFRITAIKTCEYIILKYLNLEAN